MEPYFHPRLVSTANSILIAFLLLLLLLFRPGPELFFEALAFGLLIAYHLLIDRRFSLEQIRSAGLMGIHIAVYLLLCTLAVWVSTGEEESVFWIVYLLPITVVAANLGLLATLATCAAASALFWLILPPHFMNDPTFRTEEMPELLVFLLTLFLIGVMVQAFSAQNRRQLARERDLNQQLLQRQQELTASLQRLEMMEEALRRRERLAALGEMAAGIAHEIRNPLGIISSSVQLLAAKVPAGNREGEILEIIGQETGRLNRLITDFLTFGRPAPPSRHSCDLCALLRRTAENVRSLAVERGVALTIDLPERPHLTFIDSQMIGQALLNLLLNALQATSRGGSIALSLSVSENGPYEIRITDTGGGIPEENRGKVFTPFFTTKEGGTGLGLANAYRLAESNGGDLQLGASTPEGTTFIMHLPKEAGE